MGATPATPATPPSKIKSSWFDWAFKITSVLLIPILIYMVKLHSSFAVQVERNATQQDSIASLETKVEQIGDNKIALVRLEGKVEAANEKLDDIKDTLIKLR
jgi:hypothetical protein